MKVYGKIWEKNAADFDKIVNIYHSFFLQLYYS